MYKEKDFEREQDQHKAKQVFATPLQGGLLGIKKKKCMGKVYKFNISF